MGEKRLTMALDDRATEALGHLQRAVLEMIQAARATLDLLEDMVAEPQSLAAIVVEAGHLAQAVLAAMSSDSASTSAQASGTEPTPGEPRPERVPWEPSPTHRDRSGVEHIPVV